MTVLKWSKLLICRELGPFNLFTPARTSIEWSKETIRTKVGKVRTIVLVPVMPKNKIFDGENSVSAWFSDDKNRIPVKISAELFIGSASVELIDYSGLRSRLNTVDK